MSPSEPLQTYNYPDTTPKGLVRKMALQAINGLLLLRGLRLPPYFSLRERLAHLVKGTEPDIQHVCTLDELCSQQFNLQVIRPDGGVKAVDRFDELDGHLNPSGYVNLLCSR